MTDQEIEIKKVKIKKNKEKTKWLTRENTIRFIDLILLMFMISMLIVNATKSYNFAWYQYLPPIINLIILNIINWIFISFKNKEKTNYYLLISNIFRKSILIIVIPSYIFCAIISYLISESKITIIFQKWSFDMGNTTLYSLLLLISCAVILLFMIIDFILTISLINDNQDIKEKNLNNKAFKRINFTMTIWNIIYYVVLSIGIIIFMSLKIAEKRKKYFNNSKIISAI